YESIDLSGNGRGVNGRDRTNRFQVDADAALLRDGGGHRHSSRGNQARSLWPAKNISVTLYGEVCQAGESKQNDPAEHPMLLSRRGLRRRRRRLPDGLLILLLLQRLLTLFHRVCLQTEDLPASGRNSCVGLIPPRSRRIPILTSR